VLFALYRRVDAIVAVSTELQRVIEQAPRVRARVYQLPNGVDTARFQRASATEKRTARERFQIPEDSFVVVTTGAITARKDPLCLIAAAAQMTARPLHVALAGPSDRDPRYNDELDRAIARLPERVVVCRPGVLSPADTATLLQAADVFTLTSRAEGFPNSVIEAMACGLPCIVTEIPGSRDALSEGGGYLIPVGAAKVLAEILDRLAREPSERIRLGADARRIAELRYSLGELARRYVTIYGELHESRPRVYRRTAS
jgi:glycosyltransferase involved in cell wall biosynthesis